MTPPSVETLTAEMIACKTEEKQRWADNREEHGEVFDRLRDVEITLAKMGVRVGWWAAFGAIVGSAFIGAIAYVVVNKLAADLVYNVATAAHK